METEEGERANETVIKCFIKFQQISLNPTSAKIDQCFPYNIVFLIKI